MASSRRTGWVVLAAVAGAVVAGGLAARHRRRPPAPPAAAQTAAAPLELPAAKSPADESPAPDPSRALVRMAVWGGIVVVLCILTVIVTRPADLSSRPSDAVAVEPDHRPPDGIPYPPPSGPSSWPMRTPLSLADCQSVIAEQLNLTDSTICGYETAGFDRLYAEPSADPNDPRFAGAALPTGLNTNGRICVAGSERPVLDTVRPTLSASFTATDGLQRIESTFQVTGVYGRTNDDLQVPGDYGDPLKATLEFFRHGKLKHGESYRWRVRGTPPTVGNTGWSPWCEFTIPEKTPDDLGLDDTRDYPATLTAAQWREILKVLRREESAAYAPIEAATKATKTPPVTLNGKAWFSVVNDLAWTASEKNDQAIWKLADLVSSALNGPDRVTLGHPRN